MSSVVKGAVVLAVVVFLVTVLVAATGLHENPIVGGLGFVVVAILANVAAVLWALSGTAATSGYLKQLLNALLLGVIAAVLILLLQWLNLAVLFPDFITEQAAATIEWMESAGLPEEQIEATAAEFEGQTALASAATGAGYTIATSLVVGAIVAIFKRRK